MSEELPYVTDPTRIVSSGAETLDAIGLSFVVAADQVRIDARTGPTTDRQIALDYDQIRAVEFVDGIAPAIKIETPRTEYTVTGVTDSMEQARRIAHRIKRLADLVDQPTPNRQRPRQRPGRADGAGRSPRSDTSEEAPTLETGPSSTTASRAYPSDTLICPVCEKRVEVPEQIPVNVVEVSCPGCQTTLGRVGDDGNSVIIDPDL
jgi:hypothetical protein